MKWNVKTHDGTVFKQDKNAVSEEIAEIVVSERIIQQIRLERYNTYRNAYRRSLQILSAFSWNKERIAKLMYYFPQFSQKWRNLGYKCCFIYFLLI